MSRFVLLHHECPADSPRLSHFDLMLEAEGALRTWEILALPISWLVPVGQAPRTGGSKVGPTSTPAKKLADHRLAYLDYEGPVSGDRGHVSRFDAGTLTTVSKSADEWIVALSGQRIRGQLQLSRIAADSPRWQLTFQAAVR